MAFTRESNLRKHSLRSTGKCSLGKKSAQLVTKKSLAKSFEECGEGWFVCGTCGRKWDSEEGLIGHRQHFLNLGQSCVFECQECDKVYLVESALKDHVKRIHDKSNEQFPCDICGKTFTQNHRVREHKAKSHGMVELMPHACRICGKRFVSDTMFKKHMLDKHKKVIQTVSI